MLDSLLFYVFSLLTLAGAILCVTRRSPVLSGVWLILSLLGVAGLFLLMGAEFLFVSQIILYIGGITLLFLFVVMLVNLEGVARVRQFRRTWPLVLAVGVGLIVEIVFLLLHGQLPRPANPPLLTTGNTEQLADVLFSAYFVPFELVSILLLVAILGSIWMGQRRPGRETHQRSEDMPQERAIGK